MKIEIFDFNLPEERIAKFPLKDRVSARLLVDGKTDKHIYDLPDLLDKNTLIVMNNTKVIPARLMMEQEEGRGKTFEVTLFEKTGVGVWETMIKGSKRLKAGEILSVFRDDDIRMTAKIVAKKDDGRIVLDFGVSDDEFFRILDDVGTMPLPPYMKRQATADDNDTYQTVFAKEKGAVAAPTAGLHFTQELLDKIRAKGIETVSVTLHVGAGTFLPIKSDDLSGHVMHFEYGIISPAAADKINAAKQAGKKILCLGTTALRLVETAADDDGVLHPFSGRTNLFITPGYRFKMADMLLTNFHLPKSTLFVLVCSFCGIKEMQNAYNYAIKERYRFFSYGDAMLLYRKDPATHP